MPGLREATAGPMVLGSAEMMQSNGSCGPVGRMRSIANAIPFAARRSGDHWRGSARIARMVFIGMNSNRLRGRLKRIGRTRGVAGPTRIRCGRQQLRSHAASEHTAIARLIMAAALIIGVTGADRAAKSIELRVVRHRTERRHTDDGIQDQHTARDKRRSPSAVSSNHSRSPTAHSATLSSERRMDSRDRRTLLCSASTRPRTLRAT